MTQTPNTTVDEFRAEMGKHPLGDLAEAKAVGPYVIERYERPIGHKRRLREGEPTKQVLSVHVRDTEHWRAYRELMSEFIGDYGAKEMYRRMDDQTTIRQIVAEYGVREMHRRMDDETTIGQIVAEYDDES